MCPLGKKALGGIDGPTGVQEKVAEGRMVVGQDQYKAAMEWLLTLPTPLTQGPLLP